MDLKYAFKIFDSDSALGCFLVVANVGDGVKLDFLKSINDARRLLDVLLENQGEFEHLFWDINGEEASGPGENFVREGLVYQPSGIISAIPPKILTQEVLDNFLQILATAKDLDEAIKIAEAFNGALAREGTRNNLAALFSEVDNKEKLLAIREKIEEINVSIKSRSDQEARAREISNMNPATIKALGAAEEEKLIEERIGAAGKISIKVMFVMYDYCKEVSNFLFRLEETNEKGAVTPNYLSNYLFCLEETNKEGAVTLNFFKNEGQVVELLDILFRDTELFKHRFFSKDDDFVESRAINAAIIKETIYYFSIINEGMIYLPDGNPGEIPSNILTEKALNGFLKVLATAEDFEKAKEIAETFNKLLNYKNTRNNLVILLDILKTEDGIEKFLLLGENIDSVNGKIDGKEAAKSVLNKDLMELRTFLGVKPEADMNDDDKEPMIDDSKKSRDDSSKEKDDDKEDVFENKVNLAAEKDSTKSRRGNNSSELAFNTYVVVNKDGSKTLVMTGNDNLCNGQGELRFEGLSFKCSLEEFFKLIRKEGLEEATLIYMALYTSFKLKFIDNSGETIEIRLNEEGELDFRDNKELELLFKRSRDLSEEGRRRSACIIM